MEHPGPSQGTLRRHGERYLPQFKERVIEFSRDHTYVETAREFHVHHTTVAEWVKERNKGKQPKIVDIPTSPDPVPEQCFREWLQPLCNAGLPIEKNMLVSQVQEYVAESSCEDWFTLWANRLAQEEKKSDGSHITYPVWFKRCVCNYARTFNQQATVKLFNLSRKRVWEWLQGFDPVPKTRGCKDGRAVTDTKIDEELVRWVQTEFQNTQPKGSVVRRKALEMYSAAGHKISCSQGWFDKWCRRHNLTASPRVALDPSLEDELVQWTMTELDRHRTVSHASLREKAAELLKRTGAQQAKLSPSWAVRFLHRHSALLKSEADETSFPLRMQEQSMAFRASLERMFFLGSMDELPLHFLCPLQGLERPVVKNTGKKALLPRGSSENFHAALVLSVLEDGRLLPPALLLREEIEELTNCPEVMSGTVLLLHQPEATMDHECMRLWVKHIWLIHVAIPNALVLDCLDSHDDEVVRCAMADRSCHLAVMPGGCANLLQPLLFSGMSKWFLDRLQERWEQHLQMLPMLERPLLPDTRDLIRWIAELYHLAQSAPLKEMVRQGFKSTGLRPELLF